MLIKEVFTITDGIFKHLEKFDVPWVKGGNELDALYLTRSGEKITTSLVSTYNPLFPREPQLDFIAECLFKIYSHKWDKLYATLSLEYNPISNYDSVEIMTPKGKIHTDTDFSNNNTNSIYGFDSSEPSDSDSSVGGGDSNTTQSYEDYEVKTTKKGNIGVTTSQQMLQSEVDFWQWLFFESVFKDLDKWLTIPIY